MLCWMAINYSWTALGRVRRSSAAACQVLAPSNFPAFNQTFPCSKFGKWLLSHLLLCSGLPGFGGVLRMLCWMALSLPKATTTERVLSFFQSQLIFCCGSHPTQIEKAQSKPASQSPMSASSLQVRWDGDLSHMPLRTSNGAGKVSLSIWASQEEMHRS